MSYQNFCKKCGSNSLYKEIKGNNTGLYCGVCGTFQKWLNKRERRIFDYNQMIAQMRESTSEENKAVSDYIESINKATGINIYDNKTIADRLEEFAEYLDKSIAAEYEKLPISSEDAIRKNSYCLALERNKNAIINILNGKDFGYAENK